MGTPRKWRFYIDRGGTFTDVIAEAPDGRIKALKLLSQSDAYEDAALEGIARALGTRADQLSADEIGEVRMGTTVATNALLERRGEPTVLIVTKGFADQLRIGYQNRPKLFALRIDLPDMLYGAVVEADERVTAEGSVLSALDGEPLRKELAARVAQGFASCAIVFLHGYRFPAHEKEAAAIARAAGFAHVATSHETVPLMRFVSRGDTTVADAYLSPPLARYTTRIADALAHRRDGPRLFFMTSNGGLAAPSFFRGKDAIVSGPAGGVVGMAETALAAGFPRAIGFDMGGTSTDVARFDGAFDRIYETEIAGVMLRTPMMAIHTVAAGGGSILHYDDARFRVGPDSAGANPGPKSYRRGGPLTVTDANVMTGKLQPAHFPKIFGPSSDQPLDADAVRDGFSALAKRTGRPAEDVADGFIRVAVENMANAIRRISVAKGYDPRDYALNCFGGAGGQHACLVADALGIATILIHPLSGLLSAYGIKHARLRSVLQESIGAPLTPALMPRLHAATEALRRRAEADIAAQGGRTARADARLHIRYDGSDTAVPVPLADFETMARVFAEEHARRFGFGFEGKALVAESLEVEAQDTDEREETRAFETADGASTKRERTRFYSQGQWQEAWLLESAALVVGETLAGPALLIEPHQTIVVEKGWQATVRASRAVVLTKAQPSLPTQSLPRPLRAGAGGRGPSEATTGSERRVANPTPQPPPARGGGEIDFPDHTSQPDPVSLEVFANLFMAIAEEMGAVLQNTATSVNIKERLDFSCAIFDGEGGLVANAPHMPVHLGSMGDCVTAIMKKHPDMQDGDVFVTNAPYDGGTHLPDITVVAPVFVDGERRFFTAARGHHADIGGITPGSMPPFSKTIDEEGVLFDGMRMIRGGIFDEPLVRAVLASGGWPARNPEQNLADLKAQAAACAKGTEGLHRAAALHGLARVAGYMGHVQDNAEESVRRVIGALKDARFEMMMDGGLRLAVQITVDHAARGARIDFTGTSAQAASNFNAPRSVTKAAVLYVFRCLVDSDIPMNAGCLKPLEIVVPEGSLLNPEAPGAVAAGNVETSQAVVDLLFGALGVMAAAQGTMNNLTFGNARHQYYETICGGSGAGRDFDGQSAVHTHMTNSRLTDPEVLEARLPVRVESFAIRGGSGGKGTHRGGDGTRRRLVFREAMRVAVLSTRRETQPFGLAGGEAGARGRNTLVRKNGERVALKGCDETDVVEGDLIEIETPGGGAFGKEQP